MLRLSMLELMGASINAVEDQVTMGLDRSAGALLLARSDAPGAAAAQEIEAIRAAYEANGATEAFHTDDQAEGEAFMVPRRATFDAIQRLGTLLLEDAGCRYHGCRPACTGSVRSRKGARSTLCSSRMPATETPNLRSTTQPATWPRRSARLAFGDIMALALSLGGTITGEHGVGRLKAPWLTAQLGSEAMALTWQIKDALDPDGILNPGAVI